MSARRHHRKAEQAERDDEVRVVVVVGDRQPQRLMPGEPAIERALGIDVQRLLDAHQVTRMGERGVQT